MSWPMPFTIVGGRPNRSQTGSLLPVLLRGIHPHGCVHHTYCIHELFDGTFVDYMCITCLLYTSPSPRD